MIIRQLLKWFVIGLAMGVAEIVPGVSAATVAFVAGIYERLVHGLRQVSPGLLLVAIREGAGVAWARLDGNFLVMVLAGMATTMLVCAGAVTWLLAHLPVLTGAFFGGLVFASIWLIYRRVSRVGVDLLLAAVVGTIIGGMITRMIPVNLPPTPLNLFVGGVLAMCAWLLPGMSGSRMLLMIGLYSTAGDALGRFDLVTLVCLGAGLWCGLLGMGQLLSNLLRRHHDETLSVLAGMMAGAALNLWPWRSTASYQLISSRVGIPVVQEPVSPHIYTQLTGQDPRIALAVVAAVAGFALVLFVARLASESVVDSVR